MIRAFETRRVKLLDILKNLGIQLLIMDEPGQNILHHRASFSRVTQENRFGRPASRSLGTIHYTVLLARSVKFLTRYCSTDKLDATYRDE